jgi:hypothetical protein
LVGQEVGKCTFPRVAFSAAGPFDISIEATDIVSMEIKQPRNNVLPSANDQDVGTAEFSTTCPAF